MSVRICARLFVHTWVYQARGGHGRREHCQRVLFVYASRIYGLLVYTSRIYELFVYASHIYEVFVYEENIRVGVYQARGGRGRREHCERVLFVYASRLLRGLGLYTISMSNLRTNAWQKCGAVPRRAHF